MKKKQTQQCTHVQYMYMYINVLMIMKCWCLETLRETSVTLTIKHQQSRE